MDAKFDEKLKKTQRILFIEYPLVALPIMCVAAFLGSVWGYLSIFAIVVIALKNHERLDALNCDECGTPVWKSIFYSRNGKCVGCCRDKDS